LYFWALLLLSAPLALLAEVLVPIPLFGVWGRLPWVTAWVVYYALYQKLPAACCAAALGGLLVDAFRLGQPGTTLLAYGIMVFVADRFRRQIVAEAGITAVVFGMATHLAAVLLGLGLLLLDDFTKLGMGRVVAQLLFAGAAAAVLTPLVCGLLHRIHQGLDLAVTEGEPHVNA